MHEPGALHKRIIRWGDVYCIRLSEKELQRSGLADGQEVDVVLSACPSNVDWEALPLKAGK